MTAPASTLRTISTLDFACPHPTVAIDPGPGNTAIGFLRDTRIMNCAVLRPRIGGAQRETDIADPDQELWTPSGELVALFDPKPKEDGGGYRTMAEMTGCMRGVARRVRFAHDWLIRNYADPDEPVHVVVEVPDGVPSGHLARAQSLTLELAGMIAYDLDCDTFATEWRLCAGARHRADRNPTGKPIPVELCYPEMIHDSWPEWAEPGVDGQPVRMLPNEDVGKRLTDEVQPRRVCRDAQAVFDIGKFYWMDQHERDALKTKGRAGRRRRNAQAVSWFSDTP